MRTITKRIYGLEELSPNSRARAIEDFRADPDSNLMDWNWHEDTIDDTRRVASMLGIEIDHVYFSGFGSQGDGACFTGTYDHHESSSVKAIKKYAPQDKELHNIARSLDENITCRSAEITRWGRYYNAYSTHVEPLPPFETGDGSVEELANTLRQFMDWIYKRLEAEYDYLQSDEAVIDVIKANGYEFYEGGELFQI